VGGQSAGRVQVAMSMECGRSCKRHGRMDTVGCCRIGPKGPVIKPRRINTKIVRVQNEFVDNFTVSLRKLQRKSKNISNKVPTKYNLQLERNAF